MGGIRLSFQVTRGQWFCDAYLLWSCLVVVASHIVLFVPIFNGGIVVIGFECKSLTDSLCMRLEKGISHH